MAHILAGWEIGAGRGHVLRLLGVASALEQEGHQVSLALQRPDLVVGDELSNRHVWQAPVSPRLLVTGSRPAKRIPTTLGDILVRLGLDDPAIVASQIRSWRRLLDAVRPDLVVADTAPMLMLAARKRVPCILVGNGFFTPPSNLPTFPRLIDHEPAEDEAAALASVNEAVTGLGIEALGGLPELFAAEARIPAIFPEFDPYAEHRRETPASPLHRDPAAAPGGGDELFVYLPETIGADSPLWKGIAAARLPTRVHVPRMRAELRDRLEADGFAIEPEPVLFDRIAARSRLLLSHGALGFVCAGAAAGLPHIVCHYDLEKLLTGVAVARLGVGGHASLGAIEPAAFAASLRQLRGDESLAGRARALGETIRGRNQRLFDDVLREKAAQLL